MRIRSKNLIPSAEDAKEYMRILRSKADRGDPTSMLALLWLREQRQVLRALEAEPAAVSVSVPFPVSLAEPH